MTDAKQSLCGMTLDGLRAVAAEAGLPPFAGRQMADWLYRKDVTSIAGMTNLPAPARARLDERYETGFREPAGVQVSADGTRKYLFPAGAGRFVEAAWIPGDERGTLCLSTQVGCRMGCAFCMTARQGFQAHLTAGEIVNQVRSLPERAALRNIVYMGMGEPLDNLENVLTSIGIFTAPWGFAMSPRRITVSTVGLLPALTELIRRCECHVAISLHTPFDDERRRLMPIQKSQPIEPVLETLRAHRFGGQRRLMFEYVCFKDFNDTPRHVNALARALNGLRCRVNLMRFHPVPDAPLEGSDDAAILAFQAGLERKGIITTIRRSRGLDIAAACGLLSTRASARAEKTPVSNVEIRGS